jgi:flavin-binding protein dodecin
MSVAKIIEISSTSTEGFEHAIREDIHRASKTVKHIKAAWVKEQRVRVRGDEVVEYQVNLEITFVLDGDVGT